MSDARRTRTHGTSRLLGERFDWLTEVTVFEPDRLVVWEMVEGHLHFSATSTLGPGSGNGDARTGQHRVHLKHN